LTLPLELAQRVRDLTHQGYGLADLIMVSYQHHRDQLLEEQAAPTRQLVPRQRGRSPLTVALSCAERVALDSLAERLGWTRSRTVAALLEHQLATRATADER